MEIKDYIPIKEYAAMHHKLLRNIRYKCSTGGFKTATKIAGVWLIDKREPFVDLRIKSNKKGKSK